MSICNSFDRRKSLVVLAAVVAGMCLPAVPDVEAAVDPAAACAASKQKAAAKKLSDKVKCHGVAIKKAVAVDAACLSKAETKFEEAFQKAESKGGCATTGDVDDIELLIDNTLNQLLAALPSVAEDCDNAMDDDGDGFTDCADFSCSADPTCAGESNCTDTLDNDGDGFTDCADSDCDSDPTCAGESNCSDALDNDGDGFTDCADVDCAADPACAGESNCTDGLDNDGDGPVDCADADCDPDAACAATCGNNMVEGAEQCDGTDLDGATCGSVNAGTPNGTLTCSPGVCQFNTSGCTP